MNKILSSLPRQGKKNIAKAKNGMVSSSHPKITDIMIKVLKDEGNAVDAAIAASIAGPVIEPHMTTNSGTVSFLYWHSTTEKPYFMDASPTLPKDLKPFSPFPGSKNVAAIPGSIPGLAEMAERFGTKPWKYYVEPAYKAAKEGHTVSSWEYALLYGGTGGITSTLSGRTHFPSGRQHYTPNGFQVPVGEKWKRPNLAKTLRNLAKEGPEYFTKGVWAQNLVKKANELGWNISLEDVSSYKPIWLDPIRFKYKENEVVGIPPPQRGGFYVNFIFGVLKEFDLQSMGHYTESAETLALIAWTMKRAHQERELIHDLDFYSVPIKEILSSSYHKIISEIWKNSQPKIDLSRFLEITHGKAAITAGLPTFSKEAHDSCELSIVDSEGNWVQMMETGGGGIPGIVIDGVPGSSIGYERYTTVEPGGRTQHAIANTLVLKENKPWMALGSPGDCIFTVPQALLNILEFNMEPYSAIDAPRFWPMGYDRTIEAENRIPQKVVTNLQKMGILLRPLGTYHWPMGSMQIVWYNTVEKQYNGTSDPRRLGKAAGC